MKLQAIMGMAAAAVLVSGCGDTVDGRYRSSIVDKMKVEMTLVVDVPNAELTFRGVDGGNTTHVTGSARMEDGMLIVEQDGSNPMVFEITEDGQVLICQTCEGTVMPARWRKTVESG